MGSDEHGPLLTLVNGMNVYKGVMRVPFDSKKRIYSQMELT